MKVSNMNTFFLETISLPKLDILSLLDEYCFVRLLLTSVPEL